ncbi:unnamed protein product [Gadus morhua 'NCC']
MSKKLLDTKKQICAVAWMKWPGEKERFVKVKKGELWCFGAMQEHITRLCLWSLNRLCFLYGRKGINSKSLHANYAMAAPESKTIEMTLA